jgi:hypothetical protein
MSVPLTIICVFHFDHPRENGARDHTESQPMTAHIATPLPQTCSAHQDTAPARVRTQELAHPGAVLVPGT